MFTKLDEAHLHILLPSLAAVGGLLFWMWLAGRADDALAHAAGITDIAADVVVCWLRWPWDPQAPDAAGTCHSLMLASLQAVVVVPTAVFVMGAC